MATTEPQNEKSVMGNVYQRISNNGRIVLPIFFFFVIIGAWTGLVKVLQLPTYLLPTPYEILKSFQGELTSMWPHMKVTAFEAVFGWVAGNLLGIFLGLVMSESKTIQTAVYPYLIGFRSVPTIVLAPLLILWLGLNITPILVTATIIVFFPTLVNSVTGFNSTDQLSEELMRSLDASRFQVIRNVKIYNAAPYIFSSMKIGVAMSLIGAIVGEWLVADSGIGFLIVVANSQVDTLLMFRGIILIGIMGSIWFALLSVAERYVLYWNENSGLGM